MASKFHYSKWALAAIIGDVVLTAIEVIGAISYLLQQDAPSYLVAGGAVVTIIAAMLVPSSERCWRGGRRILAILLALSLVPALSLIFSAAVERTGSGRDEANRSRQAAAQQIELKRTAANEAKVVADEDELAAKTECASGRGQRCTGLEARADKSRQRLETARTELAQAGVVPSDPQARRLAAILPVSEEAIQLYQPIVLPVSISVLGLLLIAAGAHPLKPREVVRRRGKRKKRRRALKFRPRKIAQN